MYQPMRGTPSCSQILRASRLSISLCRGTGAFAPFAALAKMVMPPALSHNATSVPPQVIQEFVTLHLAIVPA
jgi:hypothetical protein